jgi:hypothetical protein
MKANEKRGDLSCSEVCPIDELPDKGRGSGSEFGSAEASFGDSMVGAMRSL